MLVANIVNMVGGLGNQLFQYMFGSALSYQTGRPTLYDVSDYSSYTKHGGLTLDKAFETDLPILSDEQCSFAPIPVRSVFIKRLLNRIPEISAAFSNIYVDDGTFDLSTAHRSRGRQSYFLGTWQYIDYPDAFLTAFREQLQFREEVSVAAQSALDQYAHFSQNSVSIHVRLGDYLKSSKAWHLPLQEQYYSHIISKLLSESPHRHFFVFSDDIKSIRNSWFKGLPVTFVDGYTNQTAFSDLLMASCFKTIIISASTYGWWAGFLSKHDTVVYFPSPWVRPKFVPNPRYTPFIPPDWVPLSATGFDAVLDPQVDIRMASKT